LDEADNKNALSPSITDGIGDGLERAVADDAVRVIVLTNEGTTFCAGADLKGGGVTPKHDLPALFAGIQDAPKPVVGRIAGHCMGGGVGLAAVCDISLASDDIRLGFTEVRLGVAAAIISVICLPKLRPADASELLLSGRRFSAAYAASVGLINRAVPAAELDKAVEELVAELVAGGPVALRETKQLLARVSAAERDRTFGEMAELSRRLFASPEAAEGIAAFRERRSASWVPGTAVS
jgi:methylglutaconyl-CoA hydratase